MSTPEQPLAKAADADVHPVTGRAAPAPVVPAPVVPAPVVPAAAESTPPPAAPDLPRYDDPPPKDKPKRKSLKPGKGSATSDAILGATKDKLVDLGVRVPKSVRKRLKAEAKERGLSPDAIVTAILDAALDDRR